MVRTETIVNRIDSIDTQAIDNHSSCVLNKYTLGSIQRLLAIVVSNKLHPLTCLGCILKNFTHTEQRSTDHLILFLCDRVLYYSSPSRPLTSMHMLFVSPIYLQVCSNFVTIVLFYQMC